MEDKDYIIEILTRQRDSFLVQLTQLQVKVLKLEQALKEKEDGDKLLD